MNLVTIEKAIDCLQKGQIAALPTETVYGLAGAYNRPEAIQAIFRVKQRPDFDPLILHVASPKQAQNLVKEWPDWAQKLTDKFWPGPLTLVLPKSEKVSDQITAGLSSVALRCPDHPIFLEILESLNTPLAAPSANRFGRTSPTTAAHVQAEFHGDVPIVDGGLCQLGLESTVLGLLDDQLAILRPGAITQEILESELQQEILVSKSQASPGHLDDHYQPEAMLVLLGEDQKSDLPEMILSDEPFKVARTLYADLRHNSELYPNGFCIRKHREKNAGLWTAIWDRLEKASTKSCF